MFLVAGLGNPGPEYQATRHNVGFWTVEMLATRHGAAWSRLGAAVVATIRLPAAEAMLAMPMTYMNRSGEALAELAAGCDPEGLIAVYDDMDLGVGRLRLRTRGGAGGHRGVASVIENCGSEFSRVRIGIGRPCAISNPAEFVLSPFTEMERAVIDAAVERAADAVECVLSNGVDFAMNLFNADANTSGEMD